MFIYCAVFLLGDSYLVLRALRGPLELSTNLAFWFSARTKDAVSHVGSARGLSEPYCQTGGI